MIFIVIVNQALEPQVSASESPSTSATNNPFTPVDHLDENVTVSYLHHCSERSLMISRTRILAQVSLRMPRIYSLLAAIS